MRPVTEALSLHRLLHQLRPARAAPCGPSPLPTQVQGLLQREMDREGWRREGGLCPEAQKHPRPGHPSDYSPGRDARGTCQSHSWSRTWWGAGASREKGGEPWGGQGRWARGAPGRPGAGVPRPPTGPVLHHPGTPTRGPTAARGPPVQGSGWGGRTHPSHGAQSPSPRVAAPWPAAGFLHAPLLRSQGLGHGHPSTAVSPDPRTGLAQMEKQGCLWGWRRGAGLKKRQ